MITTLYLRAHQVLMMPRESVEDLLNTATLCLWCGEVWLRAERGADFWNVETRPCDAHGGGTLWPVDECDFAIGRLHGELLKREFLLNTAFVPQLLLERSAA